MGEIIWGIDGEIKRVWGIDMNNSTTPWEPVKRYCRQTDTACELATEFGYCMLTACVKREVKDERN